MACFSFSSRSVFSISWDTDVLPKSANTHTASRVCLESIKTHGLSVVLKQEETLKRALVRSLEVIGEATKKMPADFKINRNFKHIVNIQRIQGYNAINIKNGYKQLEIRSPRDFMTYGDKN